MSQTGASRGWSCISGAVLNRGVLRPALGLLIAPLAAVVPVAIVALIGGLIFPDFDYPFRVWLFIAFVAVSISLVCTLLFGLPVYLFMRYKKRYSLKGIVITGLIVAMLPALPTLYFAVNEEDVIFAFLYVACGVVVSCVFGMIAGAGSDKRGQIRF